MNHETKDKTITIEHIKQIKNNIIDLLEKIISDKMNKNEIDYLNKQITTLSTLESKEFIKNLVMVIVIDIQKEKELLKNQIEKKKILQKEKNKIKTKNYKNTHKNILTNLENLTKYLNKLMIIKKENESKLFDLFKYKDGEYMKIDNMSKKYLEILDKLNWAVIDPGMNALFTMKSKNGKIKYSYTKQLHLNRTSRERSLKRMEKIKKEEITKLENTLIVEEQRGKTSNKYDTFVDYYNKKMLVSDKLIDLYNCEKLNKIKWNQFVNEKRSESLLVNDIKKKFGNDVVLILGDWSMCK